MTLIEDLLELFHVERRLRSLRSRVDSAETYLAVQTRQMHSLQERHDELDLRKRQRQAHAANLETEATGIDERTEKLRDELNAASNTRQYHAVLNEVNNLKDKRAEVDEQTLVELSGVEQIDTELGELDEKIAERRTVLDAATTELATRREEIKGSLKELDTERIAKAANIPMAKSWPASNSSTSVDVSTPAIHATSTFPLTSSAGSPAVRTRLSSVRDACGFSTQARMPARPWSDNPLPPQGCRSNPRIRIGWSD